MDNNNLEVKIAVVENRVQHLEDSNSKLEDIASRLLVVSERQEANVSKLSDILIRVDRHEQVLDELIVSRAWVKGAIGIATTIASILGGVTMYVIENYAKM